jgi:hypothetical protein
MKIRIFVDFIGIAKGQRQKRREMEPQKTESTERWTLSDLLAQNNYFALLIISPSSSSSMVRQGLRIIITRHAIEREGLWFRV